MSNLRKVVPIETELLIENNINENDKINKLEKKLHEVEENFSLKFQDVHLLEKRVKYIEYKNGIVNEQTNNKDNKDLSLVEMLENVPETEMTRKDVVKMLVKIYIYGIGLSICGCIFLLGFGCLNWTDWSNQNNFSIPVLNKDLYYGEGRIIEYTLFCLWFLFMVASFWGKINYCILFNIFII